jgi:dihydroxyacetone kinase-like protein
MFVFLSQQIIANKENLNKADQPIGDGDHGYSMERGFEAVIEMLGTEHPETIADVFLSVGNKLIFSVGGSAGIIFGTFFRSGSKALVNKQVLDSSGIADFLQFGLEAIIKRSGAKPGDKSMIDALYPAVIKTREINANDLSFTLKNIAEAALAGMENTKSMKANIGRAKNYGDATIGYPDPGAITTYLILSSMSDFVRNLPV